MYTLKVGTRIIEDLTRTTLLNFVRLASTRSLAMGNFFLPGSSFTEQRKCLLLRNFRILFIMRRSICLAVSLVIERLYKIARYNVLSIFDSLLYVQIVCSLMIWHNILKRERDVRCANLVAYLLRNITCKINTTPDCYL